MSSDAINEITGAWDYTTLPANVRLGPGCWLERKASFERFRSTRDPGLVLGAQVRAHTWTTFNIEPTGFAEVGDGCVLVGATFMCAERITIGRNVVISYHVTIADSPCSRYAMWLGMRGACPGADRAITTGRSTSAPAWRRTTS